MARGRVCVNSLPIVHGPWPIGSSIAQSLSWFADGDESAHCDDSGADAPGEEIASSQVAVLLNMLAKVPRPADRRGFFEVSRLATLLLLLDFFEWMLAAQTFSYYWETEPTMTSFFF